MNLKRSVVRYLAENGFPIQGLSMHITLKVEKFKEGQSTPYSVLESHHNKFLVEGMNHLWELAVGVASAHWDEANARIGVGDGNDTDDEALTGLQGTNKSYHAMDTGFPTHATDKQAVFKAIFATDEGNQSWQEFTVDNGGTSGMDLLRIVADKGTKSSGETWTVTITAILANP